MTVYQRPLFLFVGLVVCAVAFLAGVLASIDAIGKHELPIAPVLVTGTALAGLAASHYFRQLRKPEPLLTLSAEGVTDEDGQRVAWSQVSKINKSMGVLFIRHVSQPSSWIARIDPAEVGGRQFSRAIEFIKANAPNRLWADSNLG